MDERCKKFVSRGTWARQGQCNRNAVKDGYCKQHHPDSVAKRNEESQKRWQEQYENSPHMQLKRALEKIKVLEAEIERLKAKLF